MIQILLLTIIVNIAILTALVVGCFWILSSITILNEWDWLLDTGGTLLAGVLAYFLFPLLVPFIMRLFDNSIAETIEQEEYKELPAREPPFWPSIWQDVRFTLKALLINIIILPLYLVPVINVFIYYAVNGYLIGTEFFNIIAGRHISVAEARTMRRRCFLPLYLYGVMVVFSATIPFVNLVVPMLAIATMVHFFHGIRPPQTEMKTASRT